MGIFGSLLGNLGALFDARERTRATQASDAQRIHLLEGQLEEAHEETRRARREARDAKIASATMMADYVDATTVQIPDLTRRVAVGIAARKTAERDRDRAVDELKKTFTSSTDAIVAAHAARADALRALEDARAIGNQAMREGLACANLTRMIADGSRVSLRRYQADETFKRLAEAIALLVDSTPERVTVWIQTVESDPAHVEFRGSSVVLVKETGEIVGEMPMWRLGPTQAEKQAEIAAIEASDAADAALHAKYEAEREEVYAEERAKRQYVRRDDE